MPKPAKQNTAKSFLIVPPSFVNSVWDPSVRLCGYDRPQGQLRQPVMVRLMNLMETVAWGQGNILSPNCVPFVRTPYFGGTNESSIAPGERLSRWNRLRRPGDGIRCCTPDSCRGNYEVLHGGGTSQRARGNQRWQRARDVRGLQTGGIPGRIRGL